MDADRHINGYACISHHHWDAVDRYSNHHQYAYTDEYTHLHCDCHPNGDLLPTAHKHVYTDLYNVTNVDSFQHQFADDHVYAFVHAPTDVHVYTIDHTLPNHCGPIT